MFEIIMIIVIILTAWWAWDYNKRIGFRDLFHDPRIGKSTFSKYDTEDHDDDR